MPLRVAAGAARVRVVEGRTSWVGRMVIVVPENGSDVEVKVAARLETGVVNAEHAERKKKMAGKGNFMVMLKRRPPTRAEEIYRVIMSSCNEPLSHYLPGQLPLLPDLECKVHCPPS